MSHSVHMCRSCWDNIRFFYVENHGAYFELTTYCELWTWWETANKTNFFGSIVYFVVDANVFDIFKYSDLVTFTKLQCEITAHQKKSEKNPKFSTKQCGNNVIFISTNRWTLFMSNITKCVVPMMTIHSIMDFVHLNLKHTRTRNLIYDE